MPEVVVVQPCLRVVVLAGEAQWRVRGAVGCPCGGAPQSPAAAPGDTALLVDEFAGRADEVGDNGEEAGVDLVLGCVPPFGTPTAAAASTVPAAFTMVCRPLKGRA